MKRILTNDYHGTKATVYTAPDGSISYRQAKLTHDKLCGSDTCTCSDDTGSRPYIVDYPMGGPEKTGLRFMLKKEAN